MNTPDPEQVTHQARELAARLDAHALEPTADDESELAALLQTFSRLQTAMQAPAPAPLPAITSKTTHAGKLSTPGRRVPWGFRFPHLQWKPMLAMGLVLLLFVVLANVLLPSPTLFPANFMSERTWGPAPSDLGASLHKAGAPTSNLACSSIKDGGLTFTPGAVIVVGNQAVVQRVYVSLFVPDIDASLSRLKEIVSRQQGQLLSVRRKRSTQTKVRVQVPAQTLPETVQAIKGLGAPSPTKNWGHRNREDSSDCWMVHLNPDGQVQSPGELERVPAPEGPGVQADGMVPIHIWLLSPESTSLRNPCGQFRRGAWSSAVEPIATSDVPPGAPLPHS